MERKKELEMLEAVETVSRICKETESCEDCPFCTEDKERVGTCCNLVFAVCPSMWGNLVKTRVAKLIFDAKKRLKKALDTISPQDVK